MPAAAKRVTAGARRIEPKLAEQSKDFGLLTLSLGSCKVLKYASVRCCTRSVLVVRGDRSRSAAEHNP